eukprot:CAMPEP_0197725706 /NCGR_PEP_ID=MMETSP1434-20131217/9570_1 /TAXON_ID=265543 /ORGANISM="Minutocellus polymorphus, Strain CCMP3303" /LENGTH=35 /DNA_ID= /DNA_START= /DNA_END= /DNA_ORIENTATION=
MHADHSSAGVSGSSSSEEGSDDADVMTTMTCQRHT